MSRTPVLLLVAIIASIYTVPHALAEQPGHHDDPPGGVEYRPPTHAVPLHDIFTPGETYSLGDIGDLLGGKLDVPETMEMFYMFFCREHQVDIPPTLLDEDMRVWNILAIAASSSDMLVTKLSGLWEKPDTETVLRRHNLEGIGLMEVIYIKPADDAEIVKLELRPYFVRHDVDINFPRALTLESLQVNGDSVEVAGDVEPWRLQLPNQVLGEGVTLSGVVRASRVTRRLMRITLHDLSKELNTHGDDGATIHLQVVEPRRALLQITATDQDLPEYSVKGAMAFGPDGESMGGVGMRARATPRKLEVEVGPWRDEADRQASSIAVLVAETEERRIPFEFEIRAQEFSE
ncbi:MAG: hypothetical protein WD294_02405 [Phycisphaeraceae bacterium]